jgi:hypothetical protein
MAEKILMFDEYSHHDVERGKLTPFLVLSGHHAGKWFMTNWDYPVTLNEVGALCNIPKEELIIMKLKYGAVAS